MERSGREREEETEGMCDFSFAEVFSVSKYFYMFRG